ncbi:MAG: hypothetical protein PHQ72_08630 [Hespellia sp.]|nr:hypothetical protein [Hespellia sp.]
MDIGKFYNKLVNAAMVRAANGSLSFSAGESIPYGDYLTTRMMFGGDNTAYCAQPLMPTPSSGNDAEAFYGAPQNYIDKTFEVMNRINLGAKVWSF